MLRKCASFLFTGIVTLTVLLVIIAVPATLYFMVPGVQEPIPTDGWWGMGDRKPDSNEITKMNIHYSNESLKDLEVRLSQTRYFDPLIGTRWEYGINPGYIKELVEYWQNGYDWRKQERILNSYDQFTTTIEGIKIHFLHYKPSAKPGQRLIPILFIHGWPGSFYEFYKIIPKLEQRSGGEIAFEVVCPSIPGYGFSEAPHRPGFDPVAAARVFSKLMNRLGFSSYYVQGGDWGSAIARSMASQIDISHVRGIHVNMFPVNAPYGPLSYLWGYFTFSQEEHKNVFPLKQHFIYLLEETGYFHLQATKPDTAGFVAMNSPAGLAAYIIEKFYTWSGCPSIKSHNCLDTLFTKDELLTNVMIYWMTGAMPSSMRLYKETFHNTAIKTRPVVHLPTGLAEFPHEIFPPAPRRWISAFFTNVVQYSKFQQGGHFPAFEIPDVLAEDVVKFVMKVEKLSQANEKIRDEI